MSAPASRPVHPCIVSLTNFTRGAEFATWARITGDSLPNLVIASASSLVIYTVDEASGKLIVEHTFGNICGSFIFLAALRSGDDSPDALLAAFAGHARLTVLRVQDHLLRAESLIDLSPILLETSYGAVVEEDTIVSCLPTVSGAVVACILGGGISVVLFEVTYQRKLKGWVATQPYVLPLSTLSLPHITQSPGVTGPSLYTNFGDIWSSVFLDTYLEPVLCLLHSDVVGRTWSGRLGREKGRGGASPLYLTALSVSVSHGRTAVLWCCGVPADAQYVVCLGQTLVVVGANAIVFVSATGTVQQVLGVNGWAKSTCPSTLLNLVQPNPIIKLALQLDGSALTQVSNTTAIVSLRRGHLYVLQFSLDKWVLLPMGQTLGPIGEIAVLTALSLEGTLSALSKVIKVTGDLHMGLIFAGSRLGDSLLLGYALETVRMPYHSIETDGKTVKREDTEGEKGPTTTNIDSEYDRILRMEEDALYAPTLNGSPNSSQGPHVVPPSDDEDASPSTKRIRLAQVTILRAMSPLDILVNPGPLGKSCYGPISSTPAYLRDDTHHKSPVSGAPAYVFPAGYGSSGGLALVTVPGRDDRRIIGEQDCVDVLCMFSLPSTGVVLLGMAPREGDDIASLRVSPSASNPSILEMSEVTLPERNCAAGEYFVNTSDVWKSRLLAAGEFKNGNSALCVWEKKLDLVILVVIDRDYNILAQHPLESPQGGFIRSITPVCNLECRMEHTVVFGCLWSTGDVTVNTFSENGCLSVFSPPSLDIIEMKCEIEDDDDDTRRIREFYASQSIVAVDVFHAPRFVFERSWDQDEQTVSEQINTPHSTLGVPSVGIDDEDVMLYTTGSQNQFLGESGSDRRRRLPTSNAYDILDYVAICRQSGDLEVYVLAENSMQQVWTAKGVGFGVAILGQETSSRPPRSQTVSTKELRFFSCGPTLVQHDEVPSRYRSFCLATETSSGDLFLYEAVIRTSPSDTPIFRKVPLGMVNRASKEQARHRSKLLRKRVVIENLMGNMEFSYNSLFRFSGVSGQDGAFCASVRPHWIVGERGKPCFVLHRTRHAAPSGGADKPVRSFCANLSVLDNGDSCFLTLHERVGKVGSQRLTLFDGLASVFDTSALFIGTGLCLEKIPMGVTIHQILPIEDPDIFTGVHPMYAVLVGRELEKDQSEWNSDGLSPEERAAIEEEKEMAKIQKQVEADLGGFDMQSEWVEEIERENCFEIDLGIGGAPPIHVSNYALWIVDAGNNWAVVDSYEFAEHEIAMTMKFMQLTEFKAEPGGSSTEGDDTAIPSDDFEESNTPFIAVGTGIVDHNGEDVSSKGRILLFKLSSGGVGDAVELSLAYEKDVFHGPVASVSCLSIEGKSRVVIGAGADVNIEQWGNGKLTQVGFFRATMEILDIIHFKNFLLLSDAYDSLHFLVWRESDKSLTLLAKDYDPIAVYAAGLLSRGASMTFVCHDDRQNLQFFQYAPGEAAARGGNKLVCRADCHLGTQTTGFATHFCRSSLTVHSATPSSSFAALKQQDNLFGRADDDQRIGVHFGTTDGSIGSIVPMSEPIYWRLMALQSVMANASEPNCALNQRAWRLYRRSPRRGGCRSNDRKKNVIDGDLLFQFADLQVVEQEDLAASIGSTVELIIDNLIDVQSGSLML